MNGIEYLENPSDLETKLTDNEMKNLMQQSEKEQHMSTTVDKTLTERGNRYGKFVDHAEITQSLKLVMQNTPNWDVLSPSQKEALEMIQHKIGRILNGDPDYDDSWVDIAGYSTLVAKELNGETV